MSDEYTITIQAPKRPPSLPFGWLVTYTVTSEGGWEHRGSVEHITRRLAIGAARAAAQSVASRRAKNVRDFPLTEVYRP